MPLLCIDRDNTITLFNAVVCLSELLCPASDINTTNIERLISRIKHKSFEHGMAEYISARNSTESSNMRKLCCSG